MHKKSMMNSKMIREYAGIETEIGSPFGSGIAPISDSLLLLLLFISILLMNVDEWKMEREILIFKGVDG
jgi:hypothetical protein